MNKKVITLSKNPYKILNLPLQASRKEINKAFKEFLKSNPKKGFKLANKAQKILTNAKERVKADALAVEIDLPDFNFDFGSEIESDRCSSFHSYLLENLHVLSDLFLKLVDLIEININIDSIEFLDIEEMMYE